MGRGNGDGDRDPISEDNWVGPDGTESGPGAVSYTHLTLPTKA